MFGTTKYGLAGANGIVYHFDTGENVHSKYDDTGNIIHEIYALKTELFSKSYNDLTDKPAIPSITGLASEEFVNTAISNLVNSAPETLDTLKELADAYTSNKSLIDTLNSAITNKADSATTLAGYGITDAYTKDEIDNKAPSPLIDISLNITDILVANDYFDVSGTGTSEDPYILLPKTTVKHSKYYYKILLQYADTSSGSVLTKYIIFKENSGEMCRCLFYSTETGNATTISAIPYNLRFENKEGYCRPIIFVVYNGDNHTKWTQFSIDTTNYIWSYVPYSLLSALAVNDAYKIMNFIANINDEASINVGPEGLNFSMT